MSTSHEAGRAWRTAGGIGLARRIVVTAKAGTPVVLNASRAGALAALEAMAEDEFAVTALRIFAADDLTPTASLATLIDPRGSFAGNASLVALIADAAVRDGIVIVSTGSADTRPWLAFAGVFASARATFAGPAAGLVLLHDGAGGAGIAAASVPRGCEALDDDAIVDPLDAFVTVRAGSDWPATLTAEAAAAALVEACRGDLDQIAGLALLSPEEAFEPSAVFARSPAADGAAPLRWRDRSESCPFWLAGCDPERLRRRIWRGQLSIVFPWLEETRVRYLEQSGAYLSTDAVDRETGERRDVAAYEFAHIAAALGRSGQDRRQVDAAHMLRHARNELAHCRPLTLHDFQRAQSAAAFLQGNGPRRVTVERRPARHLPTRRPAR